MTERVPETVDDPVDALIVQCLDEPPQRRMAALDGLCACHPALAAALRRRYAFLEDSGLVDAPEPALPERIGGFRLLRRIGRGGMGVVYLAEQESLGRQVALKVVHPGVAAPRQARERFLREVQAISRLEHPGICPVHDAGVLDGVPYLAMRYVEGETLAERIARQRAAGERLDVADVLGIGERVARALHAAHEAGVVHRDVKPDNVMLEAGTGRPLLLDFGLAQLEDDDAPRLTRPGDQLGTPAYMAPEQVAGHQVDRRTDVYALGATLYEALTFRVPHEASTREALYRRILNASVSSAGSHNPDVPRDLEVVLAKALERDPDHRYALAAELADDLRCVREHRPIQARPPGRSTRLRRWVRRHPARVSLAGAALVVGALGLWLSQALHELENRDAAAELPRIEPLWSTFVGGPRAETQRPEECVAIRLGPGRLVTVVGQTASHGLGTAGAYQQDTAGGVDAFVARYDPGRQAGRRLVWFTYLGGAEDEYVFDAEVDPATGVTTVVGVTRSAEFAPTSSGGAADGFVAQVSPDGATLPFVTRVGGSGDDRLCEVELADHGRLLVAGVTESENLPRRSNAHHGGGTDAFVARVDPSRPDDALIRSTYLGGGGRDNQPLQAWAASGGWVGNLDWMAMTLDPSQGLAVAFKSRIGRAQSPAATTPDAFQRAPRTAAEVDVAQGPADAYLVVVDPDTFALRYATFVGGRYDEAPNAIAPHPDGGFVLGGATWSPDLACTSGCYQSEFRGGPVNSNGDLFVCWIDPRRPAGAGLRYATYMGTDAGEDAVRGIAVGRDGVTTIAGFSKGNGFPITHELVASPTGHGHGALLVRLAMEGGGAADLRFSTRIAPSPTSTSLLQSVALDGDGSVWVTGVTTDADFPVLDAEFAEHPGGRTGFVLHLPLPTGR